MGFNEFLLLLTAFFSAALVYISWRLDKERLYSVILIFLILISIVGGKIVTFFGYHTNTGNIFYASIFLATYFLIERYSKREGLRSIWISVVGLVFFTILLQLATALSSAPVTGNLNTAFMITFGPALRVALASLCAYVLAQNLNVYLYLWLKKYFGARYLWFRANIANALAQILDSVVFFGIAFWGIVHPENILEVMLTGFVIKVLFMMVAAPLLYLNKVEQQDDEEYSMITFQW